jgi:hypothetical protein
VRQASFRIRRIKVRNLKFSKPFAKPSFLEDEYENLSAIKKPTGVSQSQVLPNDEDFLLEYLVKDAASYKRNTVPINLHWLIIGAPTIDIKTRFMREQIFARMKVHKNEILELLFKVFRAVLMASKDRDFEFME